MSQGQLKDIREMLTTHGKEAAQKSVLEAVPIEEIDTAPEAIETETQAPQLIFRGVNHYPTTTSAETVLLGNGWMRRGDVVTFISTAGAGKSVAVTQAAMAWGLGLPYLGIKPMRPLRIILFSGEDDGVTIGQCREGFLENSEAITGQRLTVQDLEKLDENLRTDFSREYVGPNFHPHLRSLLEEEPADLVIVNPLLSYLGGEVVGCVSEWIRAGLMPLLQEHDCGAFIAHHTPKLAKDGWDNTDDTYSGIGGAEVANIPRSILTLRPTNAKGIFVVKVSKRQTTGWVGSDGKYSTQLFIQRTDNPERPAWIPMDATEAEESITEARPAQDNDKRSGVIKKLKPEDVLAIVKPCPVSQQDLIARLCAMHTCSPRTAQNEIKLAENLGLIHAYDEPNPKGGKAIKWLKLAESQNQLAI